MVHALRAAAQRMPEPVQRRFMAALFTVMPPPRSWICALIPPHSKGAEVGVWRGDFSAVLIDLAAPAELHLIDPWQFQPDEQYRSALYGGGGRGGGQDAMDATHERVRRRFSSQIRSGQVVVHRKPSEEAVLDFDAGALDWVYIDGNHLYEYVRRDLECWSARVRPGGYLFCDDYGISGWWEDGVTRAVDEFAQRPDWERIGCLHHQVALRLVPRDLS